MQLAIPIKWTDKRRSWWRRIAKLVGAPLHYIYQSGQYLSILRARAVDSKGNPIPMITYPAFDFFLEIESELKNAEVLEFGCGQSTMWFAPRVKKLVGVEKSVEFLKLLTNTFAENPNVNFVASTLPFDVEGKFDIVIVDGGFRYEASVFASEVVKKSGIIILDNSDVQSLSKIPQEMHQKGFGRVDFFGYSPTGVRKQGTSIFFRTLDWFRIMPTVMPISKNSITEKLI